MEENALKVDSSFIGRAGEYRVCSELLFRGFNASIMSVDTGIDIVATKANQMYGIQVKTSRLNKANIFTFDIRKVSFERHSTGGIFYIFVLFGDQTPNFLILPFLEIEKKVHEKAILENSDGARYRVNIRMKNNDVFLGTLDHKMNYFLNNWNIIR